MDCCSDSSAARAPNRHPRRRTPRGGSPPRTHGTHAGRSLRGRDMIESSMSLDALESESIEILREACAGAAAGDAVLDRQGLVGDAAPGAQGVPSRAAAVSAAARRHHLEVSRRCTRIATRMARESGMQLIVHSNEAALAAGVNPFTHGSSYYTDVMKTEALQAGARRARLRRRSSAAPAATRRTSRAKERIFSFRSRRATAGIRRRSGPSSGRSTTRAIRPGETHARVSALELDRARHLGIHRDASRSRSCRSISPSTRPVVAARRHADHGGRRAVAARRRANSRECDSVRFRTLGCYPLTGAIESRATTDRRDHRRDARRRIVRAAGPADRQRSAGLDGEEEAGGLFLSRVRCLRFITCGSVDDGKSTLIGRLLYESQRDLRRSAARARSRFAAARHAGRAPRFRAAGRRPAGRARAGHHHRRRLSLLRHAEAPLHRRRHAGPRAVHAQHGDRRLRPPIWRSSWSTRARAC